MWMFNCSSFDDSRWQNSEWMEVFFLDWMWQLRWLSNAMLLPIRLRNYCRRSSRYRVLISQLIQPFEYSWRSLHHHPNQKLLRSQCFHSLVLHRLHQRRRASPEYFQRSHRCRAADDNSSNEPCSQSCSHQLGIVNMFLKPSLTR